MSSFFKNLTDALGAGSQTSALLAKAKAIKDTDAPTAVQILAAITDAEKGNLEAWTLLGDLYSEMGKPDEAVNSYRQLIAIAPEKPVGFLSLGTEMLNDEKFEEAAAHLMHGLLLSDTQTAVDLYNLALCFYQMDRKGESVPFCLMALVQSPDVDVEILLADCYYDLSKYDEAVEHFQEALGLDSENLHAVESLGFSLEQLSRFQEAIEALNRAVNLGSEEAEVFASLSRCYEATGEHTLAQSASQRAETVTSLKKDALTE